MNLPIGELARRTAVKVPREVPLEVLEDTERLGEWAAQAISCQKKTRDSAPRKKS